MTPYAIMVGEIYTYFLYDRYKFIENDKIEEGTLLNATNNSLDPYDYHLEKCGTDSFKKLERNLIHTCWPGYGEDIESDDDDDLVEEDVVETQYFNGTNEVVKIRSVLYVMKEKVFTHLDNVVISVFVNSVIRAEVI